jgi:hypothetical protein
MKCAFQSSYQFCAHGIVRMSQSIEVWVYVDEDSDMVTRTRDASDLLEPLKCCRHKVACSSGG